jgi:hypothetical protein
LSQIKINTGVGFDGGTETNSASAVEVIDGVAGAHSFS